MERGVLGSFKKNEGALPIEIAVVKKWIVVEVPLVFRLPGAPIDYNQALIGPKVDMAGFESRASSLET